MRWWVRAGMTHAARPQGIVATISRHEKAFGLLCKKFYVPGASPEAGSETTPRRGGCRDNPELVTAAAKSKLAFRHRHRLCLQVYEQVYECLQSPGCDKLGIPSIDSSIYCYQGKRSEFRGF
jgi:hypothetical protein